jgi:hypothetical protein
MRSSRRKESDSNLTIFLYDDPTSKNLNLEKIRDYLKITLPHIEVHIRKDFEKIHLNIKNIDEYAEEMARCKVRNLFKPFIETEPLIGEIRFEKRIIKKPEKRVSGILYDGYRLDMVFRNLLPREELDFNKIHIVFTNRLFGTFDEREHRYHARVILCGYPSLISTSGIVEAPAKPKEFYYIKQKYLTLGLKIPLEIIKEKFHGSIIDYDDPRLTEIMKGYAMQAVFYHLTYKPFCNDKNCRLYNAHWQEEIINAQLKEKGFCRKHQEFLRKLK